MVSGIRRVAQYPVCSLGAATPSACLEGATPATLDVLNIRGLADARQVSQNDGTLIEREGLRKRYGFGDMGTWPEQVQHPAAQNAITAPRRAFRGGLPGPDDLVWGRVFGAAPGRLTSGRSQLT